MMKGLFGLKITTGERKGSHRAEMLSETNRRPHFKVQLVFAEWVTPPSGSHLPSYSSSMWLHQPSDGPALIITSNSKGFRGSSRQDEHRAWGRGEKCEIPLISSTAHLCTESLLKSLTSCSAKEELSKNHVTPKIEDIFCRSGALI